MMQKSKASRHSGIKASSDPTSRLASSRSHGFRSRGFTLIELMVVIGIIVMLVGLTVGVSVILHQKSEVRQVEQALNLLDMAVQEWALAAERQITYGTNGTPQNAVYAVQEVALPDGHELTHEVVSIISKNPQAKEILARIDPDLLKSHDDELTIFDPWGNDFVPIFPGRAWDSTVDAGMPRDDDGTIRTPFEIAYGICMNRRMSFMSAGPDGDAGNLHLDVAQGSLSQAMLDNIERAADNVYSAPLSKERAP